MKKRVSRSFGFSMFEFLLVFVLVVMLSGYVWISINPLKIFMEIRNIQRLNDLNQIATAINQYSYENNSYPFNIEALPLCVESAIEIGKLDGEIDLASKLVDQYILTMPIDPLVKVGEETGYQICREEKFIYVLKAPYAEDGKNISVKK